MKMDEFIQHITSKYGGRIAGSEEEKLAQEEFGSMLEEHCSSVDTHIFEAALTSKFTSLKFFCSGFWIALIVWPLSPISGLIISVLTSFLFIVEFLLNFGWLDRFYPKKESRNVTGTIEPTDTPKRTILISGHMDSVWEFQWWYKLRALGGALTTVAGALFVLQPILLLISTVLLMNNFSTDFPYVIWMVLICLSPTLIVFFSIHGKTKVDGALDNLTGVSVAFGAAQYFSKNLPKNTRLKFVSFGSEETGVKGSINYVKDHLELLRKENSTIINVDTIKNADHIGIIRKETTSFISYPKPLIEKMKSSFKASGLPPKQVNLPIGGTDASSFVKKKIPALSIIGLNTKKLDPTYHTRDDHYGNLDPQGIEKLLKAVIHFIQEVDEETN